MTRQKAEEIIMFLAFWTIFRNIPLYSKIPRFSFEARNVAFCARLILILGATFPRERVNYRFSIWLQALERFTFI